MSNNTMSIQQFAFEIGAAQRKTLEASTPFAKAYAGAEPAQQRDLRIRWMIGHIMGGLACLESQAIKIREAGKGADVNPKHRAAIDRAYSDFRHHVARASTSAKGKTSNDQIEIPAHILKLAKALATACAEYESARKIASTALAQAFAK